MGGTADPAEGLGLTDADGLWLADGLRLGLVELLGLTLGETDADGLWLGETELLGETEALGDSDALGLLDGLIEGEMLPLGL